MQRAKISGTRILRVISRAGGPCHFALGISLVFLLAFSTKTFAQPVSDVKQDDKLKSRAELSN